MNSNQALAFVQRCFPDVESIQPVETVCRLWAGMGHIYKVTSSSSEAGKRTILIKHVDLKRQSQSFGDKRKADSYRVEANFYEHYAAELSTMHGITLPTPYRVERHGDCIWIGMSVLNTASHDYSNDYEEKAIRWLARFHAATWKRPAEHLQETGSYWHLDTRPDEHGGMPNKGWQGRLKKAARSIDARLKRDAMQCWIHGDPKDANILWTGGPGKEEIAFCDFQYCGKGPPTNDLAYFLCSSTDEDNEGALMEAYYEELVNHLVGKPPSFDQLKESLELAYCNYARFMAGWGFWGFDITDRVIAVLDRLDGGRNLGSEEAYDKAMRREFG